MRKSLKSNRRGCCETWKAHRTNTRRKREEWAWLVDNQSIWILFRQVPGTKKNDVDEFICSYNRLWTAIAIYATTVSTGVDCYLHETRIGYLAAQIKSGMSGAKDSAVTISSNRWFDSGLKFEFKFNKKKILGTFWKKKSFWNLVNPRLLLTLESINYYLYEGIR